MQVLNEHVTGLDKEIAALSSQLTTYRHCLRTLIIHGARSVMRCVKKWDTYSQPIVDFGQNIGVDGSSGLATRYGTIHSGKNGAHIVPTNPATVEAKP